MTTDDLLSRINDPPFRPFRVRLTNNTAIDVTEPGMVIVGPSSAVLPTEVAKSEYGEKMALRWKTIALNHIVEFNDLDHDTGSKRKRRR